MQPITAVLVGAGGYGEFYLQTLLAEGPAKAVSLVGVIDPYPERCRYALELDAAGVPFYTSLQGFYATGGCDLAIIVSPVQFHSEHTCVALAHGSHVLCEKPLCVTAADIEKMRAAEQISGRTVTIGFQWSYSAAIQQLKADILGGRFGRARRLRSFAISPRTEGYYRRNSWAGRQRLASGELILDSPVSNATGHFLHNMLYVLGDRTSRSAQPKKVEAELWRANQIENYDTAAVRVELAGDVELLFYTSHAVANFKKIAFCYEFDGAVVEYALGSGDVIARCATGETIVYGSPETDLSQKLWRAVESTRTGKEPLCGIEGAAPHVECVLAAQNSARGIQDFPPEMIRTEELAGGLHRYVVGLEAILERCYRQGEVIGAIDRESLSAVA